MALAGLSGWTGVGAGWRSTRHFHFQGGICVAAFGRFRQGLMRIVEEEGMTLGQGLAALRLQLSVGGRDLAEVSWSGSSATASDRGRSKRKGFSQCLHCIAGWIFGGEAFREGLIRRLDALRKTGGAKRRRRSGYTGEKARDHGEAASDRLLNLGIGMAGLTN